MRGSKAAQNENRSALNDDRIEELIALAKEASAKAYCPYSKFRVGAAVQTTSGEVYTGCNVENASYGLTICAERNTIFHSVAEGKKSIAAVVIYTPTKTPSAPCGACRQVINEFGPKARVICACDSPQRIDKPLSELLPDAFGPRNLA
jgi:cytidine deaminase